MARGPQYDAVDAAGAIVLSGAINVSLVGGFTPSIGNSFTILSAVGSITGQFASATAPGVSGAQWQVTYNANSVVLTTSLQGDYNRNGIVDAADYVVWRKLLGKSGAFLAADGDGNGTVQSNDFDVWRSHFGQSAGSGSGASANAAVPEPTILVMLILAATNCGFLRRRTT